MRRLMIPSEGKASLRYARKYPSSCGAWFSHQPYLHGFSRNIDQLHRMPALLAELGVRRFFIQVIGLRGKPAVTSAKGEPCRFIRSLVGGCARGGAAGSPSRYSCHLSQGFSGRRNPSPVLVRWRKIISSFPTVGSIAARFARITRYIVFVLRKISWLSGRGCLRIVFLPGIFQRAAL